MNSLVVRIAAFQAVDPGSNPGLRIIFTLNSFVSVHSVLSHRPPTLSRVSYINDSGGDLSVVIKVIKTIRISIV